MHHFESHSKSVLESWNPDLPDSKAVLLYGSACLQRDWESSTGRIRKEVREEGKNLREEAELRGNENTVDERCLRFCCWQRMQAVRTQVSEMSGGV